MLWLLGLGSLVAEQRCLSTVLEPKSSITERLRTISSRMRALPRLAQQVGRSASTSSSKSFQGVWPIVATPFHDDESLDLEGFAKSIRFFGECGASGATVCGVLGESNRLTDAERAELVKTAVGAAGAMPICVGVSHAGTRATVDLAQMAQDLGAHSIMATPTKEAFPQSDGQLFDYFAAVQDGCTLPIVLQDHPASTGVFMGAELLVQICAHLASVQCIKLEAVPTPPKIAALRKAWAAQPPAYPECSILTGLGALYGGFDQCMNQILAARHRLIYAQASTWNRARTAS